MGGPAVIARIVLGLALAAGASTAQAAVCSVQSAGVAFGAYDTLDPSPLDGIGSVHVDCDSDTSLTVDLGSGTGSFDQRRMSGGAASLDYNLYTEGTRSIVWGDGINGSDVSASGSSIDLPIYGRIPARQNVPVGTYSDTVIITVSY